MTDPDKQDDAYQSAMRYFISDTEKAFKDAFEGQPTMVEYFGSVVRRIMTQPTFDAIYEELEYAEARGAFISVLRDSQCPLVANLKKTIVDAYIKRYGDDVAEYRSNS
jgi:hypothetical protein